MELGLGINSFQINQRHVFPQNRFIETGDKVGIKESAVEDGQTETSPHKFEIAQMVRINDKGFSSNSLANLIPGSP